jgi:hypothetical protein
MVYSCGFDTRESVGNNVALSKDVSYVGGELGYEMEVVKLPL